MRLALALLLAAGAAVARADAGARLAALAENHAIVLGKARVLGDFNDNARSFELDRTGPRNRDYSVKMVWAPDRRTALFTGANHRRPHRLNDVWEFDLGAMAWKLLYAPDNSRSYLGMGEDASDVLFRDGLLVTRRGGPAVIGHSWWGITWDPVGQRMLFLNHWDTKQDQVIEKLGGNPAERFEGAPLWSFDPAAGEWRFVRTPPPWPKAVPGAMLEYVPALEGAIWHMNNWQFRDTWLYRVADNRWVRLETNRNGPSFAANAPGRELVGYYDPGRKIVVAQWRRNTYHFHVPTLTWTQVAAVDKESDTAPFGYDARTAFYHDPASGHGLFVDLKNKQLWAYDPDRVAWKRLAPEGDPMPRGSRPLAYVDAARNALVVIDDTTVWAYRYRAAHEARAQAR